MATKIKDCAGHAVRASCSEEEPVGLEWHPQSVQRPANNLHVRLNLGSTRKETSLHQILKYMASFTQPLFLNQVKELCSIHLQARIPNRNMYAPGIAKDALKATANFPNAILL